MTEMELLQDLLYYRVKDYEIQKRRDPGKYRDIVHPDPRQIKLGEIILRMDEIDLYNIKPLRRDLFYPMSMEQLDELHALVMLGAFSNLDRMLRWISASAMKTS